MPEPTETRTARSSGR